MHEIFAGWLDKCGAVSTNNSNAWKTRYFALQYDAEVDQCVLKYFEDQEQQNELGCFTISRNSFTISDQTNERANCFQVEIVSSTSWTRRNNSHVVLSAATAEILAEWEQAFSTFSNPVALVPADIKQSQSAEERPHSSDTPLAADIKQSQSAEEKPHSSDTPLDVLPPSFEEAYPASPQNLEEMSNPYSPPRGQVDKVLGEELDAGAEMKREESKRNGGFLFGGGWMPAGLVSGGSGGESSNLASLRPFGETGAGMNLLSGFTDLTAGVVSGGQQAVYALANNPVGGTVNSVLNELLSGGDEHSKNRFAEVSTLDGFFYQLENAMASHGAVPYLVLIGFFFFWLIFLSIIWFFISKDQDVYGASDWMDSFFLSLQLLTSAGFDDSIPRDWLLRGWVFAAIFIGLITLSLFISFTTDSVLDYTKMLMDGRSKVIENGHTVILGWNEATLRLVVQIAVIRRLYQMTNETRTFGILYWFPVLVPLFRFFNLLEKPSTSLAVGNIIILAGSKTKEEMHRLLEQTLAERGIDPNRTQIGTNVVCRVGDPKNVNDLVRVGVHRASAIMIMMTDEDDAEEDINGGEVRNAATLRTCLAVRYVIFTNPYSRNDPLHPELRIVMQMTDNSPYIHAACFQRSNGLEVILPVDLSIFLNSLMFHCAAKPGLAQVLLNLMNFEGYALRRRRAKNLRSGKRNRAGACIGQKWSEVQKEFETAVFIGIIRPTVLDYEEIKRQGFGLCPDPDTVIQADDLIIFFGPKPTPVHSLKMIDMVESYRQEAVNLQIQYGLSGKPVVNEEVKSVRNFLICGWRSAWSKDPLRLHQRLDEIVGVCLKGTTFTFINGVDIDEFEELITLNNYSSRRTADAVTAAVDIPAAPDQARASQVRFHTNLTVFDRSYELKGHAGIIIRHKHGDCANPKVLEPVMQEHDIHTAIVMGTQSNVRLSPVSRDTRVLSIMLLLRKMYTSKCKECAANSEPQPPPMHVVSENQEDMTAKIALGPRIVGDYVVSKDKDPDFINTQAIYARVMAQVMAYPVIKPAVEDLFSETEGSADLHFVYASAYVPLGVKISYGTVFQLVLMTPGERSICLGYMNARGKSSLAPNYEEEREYADGEQLILLRRLLVENVNC